MRKLIWILSFIFLVIVACVSVPWVLHARKAQPLLGVFDVELKCMGGHEIFLELNEDAAFEACPGHRQRMKVAEVVRSENTATVVDSRNGKDWFQITWDGSDYTIDFLKNPDSQSMFGMIPIRGEIKQMNNPWRLWIPRVLPQH